MRSALCVAALGLALASCQKNGIAPANEADANLASPDAAALPTSRPIASIKQTSWEFTQSGKAMQESIDAEGKFIIKVGAEPIDHGTSEMKNGRICSISAVDDGGEYCWTVPDLDIGQSGEAVSDKGEKLMVKRVAYRPLTL